MRSTCTSELYSLRLKRSLMSIANLRNYRVVEHDVDTSSLQG
jgi:hypothetical protein